MANESTERLAAEIACLSPIDKLELARNLRPLRPDTAWAILEQLATEMVALHMLTKGRDDG